ncbi:hypothetical protein Q8A73_017941 [Channa argus]|nr:hypothetical protein Q8A73_017941 [Channa argus]
MSIVALSPVAPEPLSPMITSVTPTLDPDTSTAVTTAPLNLEHQSPEGDSSPGPATSPNGPHLGQDNSRRSRKPPPLHTGADWKVVLHLPEIETWLRVTSDRVTQLTHSVGQDSDNRHVDVHLVQLKPFSLRFLAPLSSLHHTAPCVFMCYVFSGLNMAADPDTQAGAQHIDGQSYGLQTLSAVTFHWESVSGQHISLNNRTLFTWLTAPSSGDSSKLQPKVTGLLAALRGNELEAQQTRIHPVGAHGCMLRV